MHQELSSEVHRLLRSAWRDPGFCVPNPATYPWQWCWDSCFHAVVWAHLEPDRGVDELRAVFHAQSPSGFVPHMTYHGAPPAARSLWGRDGASTITNPPMYGHALRVLAAAGVDLPGDLVSAAGRGLRWLLDHRRRRGDLLVVCHPWETGCDDSPRWDGFTPAPFHKPDWDVVKRSVLRPAVIVDGGIVANPAFEVAAASFNALVAFNLRELATVDPDGGWDDEAERIERALALRWDGRTWVDGDHPHADADTVEALLAVLVQPRAEVWSALADPERFAGASGTWQVARDAPLVDPDGYWRGAAWAPLDYLFWVAARRAGEQALAIDLARRFVDGAVESGWAEYWNPETARPGGARPQTWTGLALPAATWLHDQAVVGGPRP